MTQNYGLTQTGSNQPDSLIAGAHPVVEVPVTIQATAATLSRGQILGMVDATGKYVKLDTTKSDGSQTPKAVLGTDVDATAGDAKSFAYVHGVFSKAALIGLTPAIADVLQARAIFVK